MKKLLIILFLLPFALIAQESSYVCGNGTRTFTASVTGGAAPIVYQWTSPTSVVTNNAAVTANEDGIWTWQATDASGCMVSGTHDLNVEVNPNATINADDVCVNSPVIVDATGVPSGYTYSWDFGTGATPATSTSASTSVQWSTTGTQTITLVIERDFTNDASANGCGDVCQFTYTDTITVGQLSGQSTCN